MFDPTILLTKTIILKNCQHRLSLMFKTSTNSDNFYFLLLLCFLGSCLISFFEIQFPLTFNIKAPLNKSCLLPVVDCHSVDDINPRAAGAFRHRALIATVEFGIIFCRAPDFLPTLTATCLYNRTHCKTEVFSGVMSMMN